MIASLSINTLRQYDSSLRQWYKYCKTHHYDYLEPTISSIIEFLTVVLNSGARYGTINSHKSSLMLIAGAQIADNDLLKRFMKGAFKLRPSLPKYNFTWDPNIILNHLSHLWPNGNLSLELLSKKTLTLLALVSAHRVQTFSLIKIDNIEVRHGVEIIIMIPDIIKTSRPNTMQPILRLPFYDSRPEVCPARCLVTYIEKSSEYRVENQKNLFISFKKPYNKVTSQSLSRWIKDTLQDSGVDVTLYTAHSTRHAATSSARRKGVSLDSIRKTAGWTEASKTFARFYHREVIGDLHEFANAILNSNHDD